MTSMVGYPPYRDFATEAARPPAPAPEPLTSEKRGKLAGGDLRARRRREVEYLSGVYVPTDTQRECETTIRDLVDETAACIPGAHTSPYFLGVPSTGKSTAVARAAHRVYRESVEDALGPGHRGEPRIKTSEGNAGYIPVVTVLVRPDAMHKSVVSQVVHYCGYGTEGSAGDLTSRVTQLARRHGFRLVIFDDVHNLATDRRDAVNLYNMIKNLNTELGGCGARFVYIGTPGGAGLGNLHANEQLASRLITHEVTDMVVDTNLDRSQEIAAWQRHLAEWEEALHPVLPEMKPETLVCHHGRLLWELTQGSIGQLSHLLRKATLAALAENSLTLTNGRLKSVRMPGPRPGTV